MTNISVAADFQSGRSLQLPPAIRRRVNQDAFLKRMDRLTSRSQSARSAVRSSPQHLDGKLLKACDELNDAWGKEVAALILSKRLRTPEADSLAKLARVATAQIAKMIETTAALTFDGLKVQARAALWGRHGEPLGAEAN
jgi:hypothetical protein